MPLNLRDLHAVVTGGARGIGRAVAEELARAGARVSVISRNAANADVPFATASADIADAAQVTEAFERVRQISGPISILIANSGVAESAPIGRTSLELWERVIGTNLTGTFLSIRAVVDDMVAQQLGRIISIASIAGLYGAPYIAAYCASKHGVIGLTRALSAELASKGITVNAICPGYVETEMMGQAVANIVEKTGATKEQAVAQLAAMNPEGRLVTTQEIAQAVMMYCASERSGEALVLPGGIVA